MYLITPFLFLKLQKVKHKSIFFVLLATCSIGLLVIISLVSKNQDKWLNNNSFGYFSILNQFPVYCLGILLFFKMENRKSGDVDKKSVFGFLLGILLLFAAVYIFFRPFFRFAYIAVTLLTGLSFYFIMHFLLCFEMAHSLKFAALKPLTLMGKSSFYCYLVHCLWVYTLIKVLKKLFLVCGTTLDTHIGFFVWLPVVILLTYFSGKLLQWFVLKLEKQFQVVVKALLK